MPPKRKATKAPSEAAGTVYQVLRDEDSTTSWDTAWHDNSTADMLQGTYSTLAAANAAAETNLLEEWDRDFFTTYEVGRDVEGLVTVNAVAEEGETFTVRVVKVEEEEERQDCGRAGGVFVVTRMVFVDGKFGGKEIVGVFRSVGGAGEAVEKYMQERKEELPKGIKKKKKKNGEVCGVVKQGGKDVVIVGIEDWDVET